jgi:hypothetical protein
MRREIGLLFLVTGLSFAQTAVVAQTTGTLAPNGARIATGRVNGNASFGTAPFLGPAVVGAPYSAERIQEHTQTLSDGTHISQQGEHELLYRDSQGRTRTERPLFHGPSPIAAESPTMVEIDDPVEGVRYTLDTQNKVAHRQVVQQVRQGTFGVGVLGANIGVAGGILSAPPLPPPPPPPGLATRSVRVADNYNLPDNTRPQFASEKLAPQTIEGVLAEGQRTTTTYAVGAMGNDRPIVVTSENWTSPDLKIMVLSKTNDPRSGESITRITNLNRTEPDPSLFHPPADYQIVDESGPFTIQFQR